MAPNMVCGAYTKDLVSEDTHESYALCTLYLRYVVKDKQVILRGQVILCYTTLSY